MWTSEPPQYPELTQEELEKLVFKARREKGQALYSLAYSKQAKGIRTFPTLTAKEFREWITKRGQARAKDLGWKGFDVDKDNENVLKILALYFTKDERFEEVKPGYSFRKGIFLAGPTGVGKTQLMELCDTNPLASYTPHTCQVIVGEFSDEKKGGQKVIDYYSQDTVADNPDKTFGHEVLGRFYDDLGQEDEGVHYTKRQNVMAQILDNRHRYGNYFRTHITSNHTLDEIGKIYGPRIEDRFYEMFNVIEFPPTAKSRRRS